MSIELTTWIVHALLAYGALGIVFAPLFAFRGAAALDPVARDGTVGFKLMILPGAALLWPLLLVRWVRGAGVPAERSAHRDRAARDGGAR